MKDGNRHVCSICGQEFPAGLMESFNTGRRMQYVCFECYKSGDLDARIREVVRGDRARKGRRQK